jgi:phage recombination protein Bet
MTTTRPTGKGPTPQPQQQEQEQARLSIFARMGERFGVGPRSLLETLRDSVFIPSKGEPPFTDTEIAAALILAEQYALNPFAREIYVTRSHGKLLVIVPVDGWVQVINRNSSFDGVDFEYQDDAEEHGGLRAVTCVLYRSTRSRPVRVTEYMAECWRDTGPWKSHPRRMLRHKALIQAARIAFGLTGLVDDDEAERIIEGEAVPVRGALKAGRAPGYLPAPELATLPEPVEQRREEVLVAPPLEEARAQPSSAPVSTTEDPSVAEKRALMAEWNKLRGKLKPEQLSEVKRACGHEDLHPFLALDVWTAAVDKAREILGWTAEVRKAKEVLG